MMMVSYTVGEIAGWGTKGGPELKFCAAGIWSLEETVQSRIVMDSRTHVYVSSFAGFHDLARLPPARSKQIFLT